MYTVIGGNGFIGQEIVKQLRENAHEVWVPEREDYQIFTKNLGILIYCAGYGDCNQGFLKVLESNTTLLAEILEKSTFEKIVYISSTRVYMGNNSGSECSDLTVETSDERRLFNLTKLVSEELLLKSQRQMTIVRPSNVYGLALKSKLFLPSIIRDAIEYNEVNMFVSPNYSKDYVSVQDVANMVINVASDKNANGHVFNVGSGINTSAKEIADCLVAHTGCMINWISNTNDDYFPPTDISKIRKAYSFKPKFVLEEFSSMIVNYKSTNI